jgi:hypothetical protein
MAQVSLSSLLIQETKEAIYTAALAVAVAIGVPVSSWQPGDPTRSLYFVESETLSTLEAVVVGYISAGFLDHATGPWLKILAKQVFNVDVPDASYAETDLTLTNGGGGVYDIAPGDLTFKSSLTGKTYHNTTGGTLLGSPATLTITVVADEAGSASSAGAGEIDTFVTTLLGVTCSNSAAAIGLDEQEEATTRQQCRDKLGSLSPNGPKDAYSYVSRNSTLTGVTSVNRVRVYPDSDTGEVTIYVAGPNGAISGGDLTAVETAIATWATPLCITPTVLNASNVSVAVTYTLWIYKSVNKTSAEVQATVLSALEAMFASQTLNPIGGNIIPPSATGSLHKSLIESTIRGASPQAFRVSVSAPSGDTALTNGQVATLGTVTPTINFVNDP